MNEVIILKAREFNWTNLDFIFFRILPLVIVALMYLFVFLRMRELNKTAKNFNKEKVN